jgi:hypothetical protein
MTHFQERMSLLTVVLFCLSTIVLAAGSVMGKDTGLTPVHPMFDIGRCVAGARVDHTFELINSGSSPITVVKVQTDSRRIQLEYDGHIEPGAKGVVTLSVDTAGLQGRILKKARLFTGPGKKDFMELTLEMEVLPVIEVTPDRIYFDTHEPVFATKIVTLKTHLDQPLKISVSPEQLEDLAVVRLETMEENREYRIRVTRKMTGTGIGRGRVAVQTNYTEKSMIIIPVMARVKPWATVYPEILDFGQVPLLHDGELPATAYRDVLIKFNYLPEKQPIKGLRIASDRFRGELIPLGNRLMQVRIYPNYQKLTLGVLETSAVIHTDFPDQRIIVVPIRISMYAG